MPFLKRFLFIQLLTVSVEEIHFTPGTPFNARVFLQLQLTPNRATDRPKGDFY